MKIRLLSLFIILLLLLLVSGCTMLSHNRYLAASGDHVERNNDSGGYYDLTWARFGKGNNGVVLLENYSAEIWSSEYYSKELSFGFILPIIPRFGEWSHVTKSKRWIRIKNTSPNYDIIVSKITTESISNAEINYTTSRYPHDFDEHDKLPINQNISYYIAKDKYVWICLPERKTTEISLQMGDELVTVLLKETSGLSWWMITV